MANRKHEMKISEGVANWNRWRNANRYEKPDLQGADLTNDAPSSMKFRGATNGDADLAFVNLRRADLGEANLHKVDLTSANLGGADLGEANLSEAILRHADLAEANLAQASLKHATLVSANLKGAILTGAVLTAADLTGANLSGATLAGADFRDAKFDQTRFISEGYFLRLLYPLSDTQLSGCIFEDLLSDAESDQNNSLVNSVTGKSADSNLKHQPLADAAASVLTRKLIRQNLPIVRPVLRLTTASVLAQLGEFRERVRSDNQLRAEHVHFHDELLMTLDQLTTDIGSLLNAVSDSDGPATEEEVEATASGFEKFTAASAKEFSKYTSPDAMAKMLVPTGIILGVGALGALIGLTTGDGLVGFGAGSLVAKLALGHAKPGEAAAKIEKALEGNESSDKPD